jgi:AraC family transcriptional regulator
MHTSDCERCGAAWREVEAARTYLHDHIGDDVSLGSLARVVGLSPFHLAREFRREVGMPPHRYLTWLRMERARDLLERSNLPVTEICRIVGFGTLSHFGSTFRRHVGASPSEYRRRTRRSVIDRAAS